LREFKEISYNNHCGESSNHKNFRVCKVNHSQNAINQGVAKSNKNVDEPKAQSTKGQGPELI
jgi:hypothetical protein